MKGFSRSLGRGSAASAGITKQIIKVKALPLVVDGATGIGFGTAVAGDVPQGNILYLGSVAYLLFRGAGGQAGLVDTWSGNFSVGTTGTTDDTLDTTDVNIIASTAVGPAVAEVSPRTRGIGATAIILDNTDNSLEVNISLIVADASISADDVAFTIDGEIYLSYIVLGDD